MSSFIIILGHVQEIPNHENVTRNIQVDKFDKFIYLQSEGHRPMWYIHTITGEHRY